MTIGRLALLVCAVLIAGCSDTRPNEATAPADQTDATAASIDSVDASTEDATLAERNDETVSPADLKEAEKRSQGHESDQDADERVPERGVNTTARQGTAVGGVSNTQSTFDRLMTEAHHAIDHEQWDEASRLVEETLQLKPNSVAAQDLRDSVARQRELIRQQDLTQTFAVAVRNERWADAKEIAQNLKTQNSDVLEQIQWIETLANAEQLADRLLASPERLSRPSTQDEVSRLQNLTANVDLGKRIGEKMARLNELNRDWTMPVVIKLNSDGRTNVILRPGRNLGRFRSQKIQLMPGDYQLIGRRDGFREVRQSLRLSPNMEPKTIEIKASERF